MNNNNLKEEVTILKTWKWESFEIDIKYEDFLQMEMELKEKWEDGFNSSKYRRYIKFSSIEDKIWKTKYIALPESKITPFHELPKEDRDKIKKKIEEMMEKTFEARKEKFIKRREAILNDLKKTEEYFWLDTTQGKLKEYLKFKNNKLKDELHNTGEK